MQEVWPSQLISINKQLKFGQKLESLHIEDESGDTIKLVLNLKLPNGLFVSGYVESQNDIDQIAEKINNWAELNYKNACIAC